MTELKVLKHEVHDTHYSVQMQDADIIFWMDVSIDKEFQDVNTDWNAYIFEEGDPLSSYQDDDDNFDQASSLATSYLVEQNLIHQDQNAKWHDGPIV